MLGGEEISRCIFMASSVAAVAHLVSLAAKNKRVMEWDFTQEAVKKEICSYRQN